MIASLPFQKHCGNGRQWATAHPHFMNELECGWLQMTDKLTLMHQQQPVKTLATFVQLNAVELPIQHNVAGTLPLATPSAYEQNVARREIGICSVKSTNNPLW